MWTEIPLEVQVPSVKPYVWSTILIAVCVFIISAGPPEWAKTAVAKWVWGGLVPVATYLKGKFEDKPGAPTDVHIKQPVGDPVPTHEVPA